MPTQFIAAMPRCRALVQALGVCLWAACLVALPASARAAPRDYQVQAAMLYKFLTYIEWPEDKFANPHTPYRIAVLGDGEVEEELRRITAQRQVNGREVQVYRITRVTKVGDPHLLFVGRAAEKYLPRLAKKARKRAFLIVTENSQELKEGSTINLRLIDGRIGFDVSLARAQQANLRLSARLLSVAATVERAEP